MSGLTKSTLSASAAPFSPPPSFSVSANAPVFVPQRTKLNPCAAAFDFSKLGAAPAAEQSPVVLHVEPSPQPSFPKPFSEPHKSEPEKSEPEPQKSEPKPEPNKTETEHKTSNKAETPKPEKVDTHKIDTHKPEPAAPPVVVKRDKYVYTRQELLGFREVPCENLLV